MSSDQPTSNNGQPKPETPPIDTSARDADGFTPAQVKEWMEETSDLLGALVEGVANLSAWLQRIFAVGNLNPNRVHKLTPNLRQAAEVMLEAEEEAMVLEMLGQEPEGGDGDAPAEPDDDDEPDGDGEADSDAEPAPRRMFSS